MTIRLKIALVLIAGMLFSLVSATWVSIRIQRDSIQAVETEKVQVLMSGVQQVTQESILSKDPFMLLDYLNILIRHRAEVVGRKVLLNGRWEGIGNIGGDPAIPVRTLLGEIPPVAEPQNQDDCDYDDAKNGQ